jgi:hypothetical protein
MARSRGLGDVYKRQEQKSGRHGSKEGKNKGRVK